MSQKVQRMSYYIHQEDNWPNFKWESNEFVNLLSEARNLQARLIGRSTSYELKNEQMPAGNIQ